LFRKLRSGAFALVSVWRSDLTEAKPAQEGAAHVAAPFWFRICLRSARST
jgi:hypothetical protein